jgi:hypothetical protein
MKISREWATPVTIGAFVLMSVTGLLMFFHLDRGLNKVAHEWMGWVMVLGVSVHAAANWSAFKQHFLANRKGRLIIGAGALILLGSFFSLPGSGERASPPQLAMRAVTRAPLANVAPLAGRPVEQLITELVKAGVKVANANASLESAVGGNRELQANALRVLFGKQSSEQSTKPPHSPR